MYVYVCRSSGPRVEVRGASQVSFIFTFHFLWDKVEQACRPVTSGAFPVSASHSPIGSLRNIVFIVSGFMWFWGSELRSSHLHWSGFIPWPVSVAWDSAPLLPCFPECEAVVLKLGSYSVSVLHGWAAESVCEAKGRNEVTGGGGESLGPPSVAEEAMAT